MASSVTDAIRETQAFFNQANRLLSEGTGDSIKLQWTTREDYYTSHILYVSDTLSKECAEKYSAILQRSLPIDIKTVKSRQSGFVRLQVTGREIRALHSREPGSGAALSFLLFQHYLRLAPASPVPAAPLPAPAVLEEEQKVASPPGAKPLD